MIRRTTWIMLGVFILVLAAALVWQRTAVQRAAEATPTPVAENLLDTAGRQVQALQISSPQGESLGIEKGLDGSWVVTKPAGSLADQARVDQLVGDLGALQVTTKLDTTPGLENLGLNPAKYRIAVTFADGPPAILFVGDKTPTQDGYYAYREGDQVVVVAAFPVESVLNDLSSPPVQNPPLPLSTEEIGTQEP